MNRRPNILSIMSDQHAPSVLGCLGHPCVKTPHIDALARRGVTFTQACCNYPMCTPSRASFLTGLLTPEHAVWELGSPMSAALPTWAHGLRAAGYLTSIAGKMHFIGDEQLHGFDRRVAPEVRPTARPFAYDPWLNEIQDEHVMLSAVQNAGRADRPTQSEQYDRQVHDGAMAELEHLSRHRRDSGAPWALSVGYLQPHAPYHVSAPWFDLYRDDEIPMPHSPPSGRYEDWLPEQMIGSRKWLGLTDDGATPVQVRTARRAYYAMTSQIDHMVGQLVERLRELGELDNTVILYTSDHGDNHGEHGMWSKLNFYQESVGLPFVVSLPPTMADLQTPASVCHTPISLIDWLPTLLEITGVTWPRPLPGRSLLPLMKAPTQCWDGRPVIADYACGGTRVPLRMVRMGRYKACFGPPHPPVLFDLQADPREWHNLAARPDYQTVLARMEAAARADGWDPARLLNDIRKEKRTLEFLRSIEGGQSAPARSRTV